MHTKWLDVRRQATKSHSKPRNTTSGSGSAPAPGRSGNHDAAKAAVAVPKPLTSNRKADQAKTIEEILAELQADPAFAHLDVAAEYARCSAWCTANHKQPPSRQRFTNWLLRAEKPLSNGHRPEPRGLKAGEIE
jgi:hypothetical protein